LFSHMQSELRPQLPCPFSRLSYITRTSALETMRPRSHNWGHSAPETCFRGSTLSIRAQREEAPCKRARLGASRQTPHGAARRCAVREVPKWAELSRNTQSTTGTPLPISSATKPDRAAGRSGALSSRGEFVEKSRRTDQENPVGYQLEYCKRKTCVAA